MKHNYSKMIAKIIVSAALLSACQTNIPAQIGAKYNIKNDQVQSSEENTDGGSITPQGVGVEAIDVITMTELMVNDIISSGLELSSEEKPKIIVDSNYLINDSSSIINKDLLTDRLRVGLIKNGRGLFRIVGRQNVAMVVQENELKEADVVSGETADGKILGADFRLSGRITSIDAINTSTNQQTRYNQINFELIDLESSEVVWSNIYSFEKTGAQNVIYQ